LWFKHSCSECSASNGSINKLSIGKHMEGSDNSFFQG
jgi:hypothetical protein